MKKFLKGAAVAVIAVLASCSNIPEDERLIYIEPQASERNVLIEDFTGQRCVNCPKATESIHKIQEAYGENVIAVAIHCGSFGFKGNKSNSGLITDAGNEYWNRWFEATQGQPVAKINRGEKTESYEDWAADVMNELKKPTDVTLKSQVSYNPEKREATIQTEAISTKGKKAKIQIWLIEDGIVAMQSQPDGSTNREYVHNHVLRAALNGTWGEDIVFGEGQLEHKCTYVLPESFGAEGTLPSPCVPENCKVVVFVYDDSGVLQVVQEKVVQEE